MQHTFMVKKFTYYSGYELKFLTRKHFVRKISPAITFPLNERKILIQNMQPFTYLSIYWVQKTEKYNQFNLKTAKI